MIRIQLGSAVGAALAVLAMSAAGAAERPMPAPEGAAIGCPQHGPGFVQVPGTATCVRIGGRVRAEAGTGARRIGRDDIAGSGVSGRVSVDTRTDTAYGPVRTFVRMRAGQPIAGQPGTSP